MKMFPLRTNLWSVTVWAVAALLTFVLAVLVALIGPSKPAFLMIGAIAGLFLFVLGNERLLLLMAIMVFLVIGQLIYFARINQALWIPYGLCALLFLRIPSAYMRSPFAKTKVGLPLGLPLLFFVGVIGLSIAINRPPLLQVIVGGKNLLMLWSVFLLLALFAVPLSRVERGFKVLFALVYLQIPFVLYQYFVVAPKRSNLGGRFGVSWDAVVGSFGGDPNSGGASGTMAYMLILGAILAISLWRYKQMRFIPTALLLGSGLVCIALAEVKVVVVLLPLALAVLYRGELLRRPARALLGTCATIGLVTGILLMYNQTHNVASMRAHDLGGLFDQSFGYSLDDRFINFETGEMGRMAALKFWWTDGMQRDPLRGVLGYGPGASRGASQLAVGEVARKYKFSIDRSAASQLLWDVGLLGFLSFTSIFVGGAVLALRAANQSENPVTKATLEACAAGLAMCLAMLPYGRDILEVPAMTFGAMCMLGFVAQACAQQAVTARRSSATLPPRFSFDPRSQHATLARN